MRRILVLFLSIAVAYASAQKVPDVKSAPSPDRRVAAAAAVVSYYVTNRSPALPVIHITVAAVNTEDVLSLVRTKPAKTALKAGDKCEVRGEKLVDKDTGESCEFFQLSFKEFTDQQAKVRVLWTGPNLEWSESTLVLRAVQHKWEVVDDQIDLIP